MKNLENITVGLELAEIDMRMRGHGDIYGTTQHGFKKFKVADINNLELLEKAKLDAQYIYPELDNYPLLKDKLKDSTDKLVENN